jgi:hypothetical protein
MIKNSIYFIFKFLLFSDTLRAQQQYTISGFIRDAKTGEDLNGATVSIKDLSGKGAATNAYGHDNPYTIVKISKSVNFDESNGSPAVIGAMA